MAVSFLRGFVAQLIHSAVALGPMRAWLLKASLCFLSASPLCSTRFNVRFRVKGVKAKHWVFMLSAFRVVIPGSSGFVDTTVTECKNVFMFTALVVPAPAETSLHLRPRNRMKLHTYRLFPPKPKSPESRPLVFHHGIRFLIFNPENTAANNVCQP